MDTHTATEARSRYACICVQVDISKYLTTTVRIGQIYQSVVNERVIKLCFSCGHLGHRREACQYTIKPLSSPPKDSPMPNDADKVTHAPPSTEAQTVAQDISEVESIDAAFGPWMVVSRKRKDARVPKKNHNNTFSILSHAYPHVSPKEPLGINTFEKDSGGLSITKVFEGKRKAHAKLNSSPSIEAKELIISSNRLAHRFRTSKSQGRGPLQQRPIKDKTKLQLS